jgi:hypothetical protein
MHMQLSNEASDVRKGSIHDQTGRQRSNVGFRASELTSGCWTHQRQLGVETRHCGWQVVPMTILHQTAASLSFFGDDLDPDEITRLLGGKPTVGVRKGGVWHTELGVPKTAYRGSWRVRVARRSPGDLDSQVAELFAPLSNNMAVWNDLSRRFKARIFCGLFLNEFNEGLVLAPETLIAIGSRGLNLDLDIYAPEEENEVSA